MKTIPAAYTWDDAQHAKGKIAVRILRPGTPAARVAKKVNAYFSKREGAYIMRPAQFRRFQQEYARVCKHPHVWMACLRRYALPGMLRLWDRPTRRRRIVIKPKGLQRQRASMKTAKITRTCVLAMPDTCTACRRK